MDSIDLGRSNGGPELAATSPSDSKHYPNLYIDGGKDLASLPDCGTMTVYFRTTSRSTQERDGKETRSVCLEVQKILDVESDDDDDDDKSDRKSAEKALDKYAEEEARGKD